MAMSVRNCLGVDIGSHTLRVAQMEMGKAGPRVVSLVEEDINVEPGLTEAQRSTALSKQLSDLLKRSGIRARNAVFCIPGQSVFVRRIKLPRSEPEKIARMVRFEARQQIPFPLDKTIMEFQVFEEEDSPEVNVLLVAIKRDYILNFMKLVRRTGLKPLAISVSSLALYNFHELNTSDRELIPGRAAEKAKAAAAKPGKKGFSLFKKKGKDEEAEAEPEAEEALEAMGFEQIQAYVNIGASLMDLAIPKPGSARMIGFTRSVPLAGNEVDRAIREKLGMDPAAPVRELKERQTAILSTQFEIEGNADAYNMEASEAATQVADRLISELRRTLEFYISTPDGVAVDNIVLSGGMSRMPFLPSYIEERLGLPVELAAPRHEQLRMPERVPEPFCPFAIAVGLALQGLGVAQNTIDFLPEDIKNVRAVSQKPVELVAMLVMLVAMIGMSLNVGDSRIREYNTQRESLELSNERNNQLTLRVAEAEKRQANITEAYEKLGKTGGWRDYWLVFLDLLTSDRPAEVLVDEIMMRTDGNVVIRGKTPNPAAVNSFIEDLVKRIPELEVKINDIREMSDRRFPSPVFAFVMTVKSLVTNERMRALGKSPETPESRANARNNQAQGAFGMPVRPGMPAMPGMQAPPQFQGMR